MGIQQDIKQSKFNSDYHKLSINLIYTSNWYGSIQDQFFKRFALTPEQFNILRILRGQNGNPVSITLLQERMLNPMSNVSRLIDKLVKKQLVSRKTSDTDRRACEIIITRDGMQLLSKIDKAIPEMEKVFSELSPKEAQICNELLDKIRTFNTNHK